MKRLLILTITCFFFAIPVHARQLQSLVDSLARRLEAANPQQQTTIYLRSQKDIYVAGEDLWFNAFVLDAQAATLSQLDNILYVQLVNAANDSVVWKEMYPIVNGLAAGHVFLPHALPAGPFFLKAYSAHSFFSNRSPFTAATPIQVVTDPRSIKRYGRLTPTAQYQQGKPLLFTVMPTGGQLIAGIPNKVVFKASDPAGVPYALEGQLLRNDTVAQHIPFGHAGINHFTVTPQAGARYAIRLNGLPDSVYKLPAVVTSGIQLSLDTHHDSLLCRVVASQLPTQTVLISLQARGELQAIASGKLSDSLQVPFNLAGMPPGVAIVTVYNEQLHVLCSQPVFVRPQPLTITFSEVKETYGPKELVTVRIRTTNAHGQPVPAMLSLRIHDQLFANRKNVQDIQNHYSLSTQLHETLYDPAWYFEGLPEKRIAALNLLLQLAAPRTQLPAPVAVLSDSLPGTVLPTGKQAKPQGAVSLLVFNYNKTQSQLMAADNNGSFYLTPEQLATGRRFFIKYLAEKEHAFTIADPFELIRKAEQSTRPIITGAYTPVEIAGRNPPDTGTFQYGHLLQEVVIQAKGRGYGDRYLGYLDSIAKFEGNTDFIGQCGWLNCPACGSGTKPKEGVKYAELTAQKRNQVTSHPYAFGQGDMHMVTYKYPSYTEEELLKKFKMIMTRGFYQDRVYQSPDYSREDKAANDMRNSLYWSPMVVTDEHGEATVQFYTSDIRSGFIGIAEGISQQGALGIGRFSFGVR